MEQAALEFRIVKQDFNRFSHTDADFVRRIQNIHIVRQEQGQRKQNERKHPHADNFYFIVFAAELIPKERAQKSADNRRPPGNKAQRKEDHPYRTARNHAERHAAERFGQVGRSRLSGNFVVFHPFDVRVEARFMREVNAVRRTDEPRSFAQLLAAEGATALRLDSRKKIRNRRRARHIFFGRRDKDTHDTVAVDPELIDGIRLGNPCKELVDFALSFFGDHNVERKHIGRRHRLHRTAYLKSADTAAENFLF